MNARCLLAATLMIAGVALSASGAWAQASGFPATPPQTPPPRECTLVAGRGSVTIQAGPATGPGLSPIFPITEPCPQGFSGMCRRWEYRWIYTGINPSHAFVSFDTDVTVFAAEPAASVSEVLEGDSQSKVGQDIAGERILRYNANATTCRAAFWTPDAVTPGTMTAGFQSGGSRGFCAIAGADNPFGDPALSTPVAIETNVLGCRVLWQQSPDGCVLGAQILEGSPEGCTIETDQNLANTNTASCSTEINVPGSCKTCRWSSTTRTYTCTTRTDIDC